jgi:hypothetical protein
MDFDWNSLVMLDDCLDLIKNLLLALADCFQ